MKKMLSFFDYINESIITLSDDVIFNLKKIYNIVDNETKEWIFKILKASGTNIDLTPKNDYDYTIYNSTTKGYYNLEIDKGDRKQTQIFKIGKSLMLLVPTIPNHILSKITAALQSTQNNDIMVVEGEKIVDYYRYNLIDDRGTLGRSCMNHKPRRYFDLYKNNKNIKLAVLSNDEGQLIGRALLWNTNEGWLMDRVYYNSDSVEYTFHDWAKSNNYKTIDDIKRSKIVVDLEEIPQDFPYLDNFKLLCINKKQISNRDIFEREDQVIYLESTDGGYGVMRNYKLPLQEVYSISEIYKNTSNLTDLINLSIDFNSWYEEYIKSEVEYYNNDEDEFIDVFDSFIEADFEKLNLDDNLTKENISDVLREYYENDNDKFKSIVEKVIRHRYSKEHGYNNWKDINEEIYGSRGIEYNYYSKDWIEILIKTYCSEETLNVNLKKLYDENYREYERVTEDWFV